MRISDWSSDVCSSDLVDFLAQLGLAGVVVHARAQHRQRGLQAVRQVGHRVALVVEVLALALDQRVDAGGERLELSRMMLAHPGGLPALHALELVDHVAQRPQAPAQDEGLQQQQHCAGDAEITPQRGAEHANLARSEEHTSELQSLMRISYAVFCLKKKKK